MMADRAIGRDAAAGRAGRAHPSPSAPGHGSRRGRGRWTFGGAALAGLAVAGTVVVHGGPRAAPCGTAPAQLLLGANAVTADDVWAVGVQQPAGVGGPARPLIERWNGVRWRIVGSPAPRGLHSELTSVAAVGSHQAWAVGSSAPAEAPTHSRPLALHWGGRRWTPVPVPSTGTGGRSGGAILMSVAAGPGRTVFAVGSVGAVAGRLRPLAVRWVAGRWRPVPVAMPLAARGASPAPFILDAVAVLSAHEAVAVGTVEGASRGLPVVELWTGAGFHPAPAAAVTAQMGSLAAIARSGPQAFWALGAPLAGSPRAPLPVARWSAGAVRVDRAPSPGSVYSVLLAVAAGAGTNVWAVGALGPRPGGPTGLSLIEGWDGTAWRRVASPEPGRARGADDGLDGVTALGRTQAWAVGGFSARACAPTHPLVAHWDGRRWAAVSAP